MFASEGDAKAFEASLTQVVNHSPLSSAIYKYVATFTARKSKRNDEKHYFEVFFDYIQSFNVGSVAQIKLQHLQQFQTWLMVDRKLKATSVNRYFNTYKHFFNACVDWGYMSESPAAKLKDLPEDRSQVVRKIWSDEQIEKALDKAEGWLKGFASVVAYTGMRPIEVCRLTWAEHVDFRAGKILAVTYKGKGQKLTRWMPLPDTLLLQLKKRKLEFGGKCGGNFVFASSRGKALSSQVVAREFSRSVTKPLGMKGYSLYGMRHSFATRALESGVDLNELRMMMGHTNLNTTQVYLQYTDDHLRAAMMKAVAGRKIGGRLDATNLPPSCHQLPDKNS
jgi:site-specific recombinase XerD